MTNLTELEKKYEELGKEIEALKTPKPYNGIWIPEMGERYYTINVVGKGDNMYWDCDDFDNSRLMLGLVFRTAEECDHYIKMMNKAFEIRKAGREEFKVGEKNRTVGGTDYGGYIFYNASSVSRRVYFDNDKQARDAFAGVSRDDIYYMISKGLI